RSPQPRRSRCGSAISEAERCNRTEDCRIENISQRVRDLDGRVEERRGCGSFFSRPLFVPPPSNPPVGFSPSGFPTDFVTCTRKDLSKAVASKPPTSQRQPRRETAEFRWNAWWYAAAEGSIELDRRRSDLLWRTAGPRPHMRSSSATHATGRSGRHGLAPMVGYH